MTVQTGRKAPNFHAKATDGDAFFDFDLHEQLGEGPVVLAFFPFAFSSTCHDQLCDLRDHLPELQAVDAKAFGISTDSPYALAAWHREQGFGFPLVSDYNREGLRAWDLGQSLIRGLQDHHKRACFVLDREGVVTWAWVSEDPDGLPGIEAIQAAVSKARRSAP